MNHHKLKTLFNKENLLLFFLIIITFISRYLLIKDGLVPFQFDHGKDSLAILDMWLNKNPKLVGPWTSIPGLYFGPAWYYLLLPSFLFGSWHPLSPVYMMIFLLILQVVLAYRYLGKEEAILMATAPLWIMISTSAWNPFPMTLISLVILIIIKRFKEKKSATSLELFIMAFMASLACHFSTAFAILYPILILFSLYLYKIKLSWKKVLLMLFAYLLPFIPQIIFEFRHDFVELKAVFAYLQNGESQSFSVEKIQTVLQTIIDYFKFSVAPNLHFSNANLFNQLLFIFFIILTIIVFVKKRKKLKSNSLQLSLSAEYWFWPVLTLITYTFLHFNVWYVLALVPLFVIFAGDVLRASNKFLRFSYLLLMLLSLICKIIFYYSSDREQLAQGSVMLKSKVEAIELIRADARQLVYNSYHYAPDIYDFPYQYLYFWQALQGKKLPLSFSYQKDESSYVVQKPELLNYFQMEQGREEVELNYFIVEPAEVIEFQDNWWGNFGIDNTSLLEEIPSHSQIKIYKQTLAL